MVNWSLVVGSCFSLIIDIGVDHTDLVKQLIHVLHAWLLSINSIKFLPCERTSQHATYIQLSHLLKIIGYLSDRLVLIPRWNKISWTYISSNWLLRRVLITLYKLTTYLRGVILLKVLVSHLGKHPRLNSFQTRIILDEIWVLVLSLWSIGLPHHGITEKSTGSCQKHITWLVLQIWKSRQLSNHELIIGLVVNLLDAWWLVINARGEHTTLVHSVSCSLLALGLLTNLVVFPLA